MSVIYFNVQILNGVSVKAISKHLLTLQLLATNFNQSLIRMKNKVYIVTLFIFLFVFNACAVLDKSTHVLAIDAIPEGTEIYANGYKMGLTPIVLNLKENTYSIVYQKEGYQKMYRYIHYNAGIGWVMKDIYGNRVPINIQTVLINN